MQKNNYITEITEKPVFCCEIRLATPDNDIRGQADGQATPSAGKLLRQEHHPSGMPHFYYMLFAICFRLAIAAPRPRSKSVAGSGIV